MAQRRNRGELPDRVVLAARLLLALNFVVLALIVLTPADGNEALGLVGRIARGIAGVTGLEYWEVFPPLEFAANILMFVPFGVLLPLAIGRLSLGSYAVTVGFALATSICVELVQMLVPGRVTDPRDLASNVLGAVLGVLILHTGRKMRLSVVGIG